MDGLTGEGGRMVVLGDGLLGQQAMYLDAGDDRDQSGGPPPPPLGDGWAVLLLPLGAPG